MASGGFPMACGSPEVPFSFWIPGRILWYGVIDTLCIPGVFFRKCYELFSTPVKIPLDLWRRITAYANCESIRRRVGGIPLHKSAPPDMADKEFIYGGNITSPEPYQGASGGPFVANDSSPGAFPDPLAAIRWQICKPITNENHANRTIEIRVRTWLKATVCVPEAPVTVGSLLPLSITQPAATGRPRERFCYTKRLAA